MPRQINDLRLPFVWVGLSLDLIHDPPPANAPLAFLGQIDGYASAFELSLLDVGLEGLQVPWVQTSPAEHHFWTRYLGGMRVPGHIDGNTAWERLVPLRGKLPAESVKASWVPGRLFAEGFFYPHGCGLVVTAEIRSSLPLEDAVQKGFEVRHTGRFQVQWEEEGPTQDLSLDNLAHFGLAALSEFALGDAAPAGGMPVSQPFTVATVVNGLGVDRDATPPQGVHLALHALTEWPRDYDWQNPPQNKLSNLATSSIDIRAGYPGDVLYAQPRGRAVWFPKWFVSTQQKRRTKLSCYHRNLVFLSLQVESLGALIHATADQIRAGNEPARGSTLRSVAGQAAEALSWMYRGDRENTYRSWSARAQIKQNGLLKHLDLVRDRILDEGPLV